MKTEPVSEDLLVAIYEALLKYWLSRQLPKEKAEDLAQEGLVKCLRKAQQWKKRASLKTFLITVGKNGGRDYLRKELQQERIKRRMLQK